MKFYEEQYLDTCSEILRYGVEVKDRTGVGTRMMTNVMIEHSDVDHYFPIPVTKKLALKSVIGELLWFLEGSTSDRRLAEITYGDGDYGTIWTANWEAKPYRHPHQSKKRAVDFNGSRELGPVYGNQWRKFGPRNIDQIVEMIEGIKSNPFSRRHVVSAWNVNELPLMSLPPCHTQFIINVIGDRLDMLMTQRSGDMFLGVPFNFASYALLLKIIAKETGYKAGKLSIVIANAHIYLNHVDQVQEQLFRRGDRVYREAYVNWLDTFNPNPVPQILISNDSQLFNSDGSIGYKVSDFTVANYNPLSVIKGDMAV